VQTRRRDLREAREPVVERVERHRATAESDRQAVRRLKAHLSHRVGWRGRVCAVHLVRLAVREVDGRHEACARRLVHAARLWAPRRAIRRREEVELGACGAGEEP